MKTIDNISIWLLGFYGTALIGIGLFFIFLRPPLLPEDLRFMGVTVDQEIAFKSLVAPWLENVFQVLGGYIISSGVFFMFVAFKLFRKFEFWIWMTTLLAGMSSIGVMTIINFKIRSDFKWWLLILSLIWISSLALKLIVKIDDVFHKEFVEQRN